MLVLLYECLKSIGAVANKDVEWKLSLQGKLDCRNARIYDVSERCYEWNIYCNKRVNELGGEDMATTVNNAFAEFMKVKKQLKNGG